MEHKRVGDLTMFELEGMLGDDVAIDSTFELGLYELSHRRYGLVPEAIVTSSDTAATLKERIDNVRNDT